MVQLTLWTIVAYPMNMLVALQRCIVRIDSVQGITFVVPFKQQRVLLILKCWLLSALLVTAAAAWTACVIHNPACSWSLPLISAVWAFPVSSGVTARKCLLRCVGISAVIPITCYCRCFGGKRVMLAHLLPLTIWALCATCPTLHCCCPNMRAACWTVGARPHHPSAAMWCHLDTAKQSIVVRVPLLL